MRIDMMVNRAKGRNRARPLHLLPIVLVATLISSCSNDEAAPPRPNVILWLADTLRADHLGCYGYERPTSPNMDRASLNGVLFENAHAHANWTQPSVTSILSGIYPPLFEETLTDKVPPGILMLPEWFKLNGYNTYGITLNGATSVVYGYSDGFEVYREMFQQPKRGKSGPEVAPNASDMVDEAIRLIEQHQESNGENRPFFLYLQSMDPHAPYTTHPDHPDFTSPYAGDFDGSIEGLQTIFRWKNRANITPEDKQHLIDLYDGEIVFNDDQFGRLLEELVRLGLDRNTLTVVLSDHGEEMLDRGKMGHSHRNLHAELTHVPLIFYWPDTLPAGLRLPDPLGAIDIAPTILDLAGVPPLPDPDGQSLGPAVRGQVDLADLRMTTPRIYIHHSVTEEDLMAVRTKEFLFILDQAVVDRHGAPIVGPNLTALYDLTSDPDARVNIASKRPEIVEKLTRAAEGWISYRDSRIKNLGERLKVKLGPEMRETLEQLGYLR